MLPTRARHRLVLFGIAAAACVAGVSAQRAGGPPPAIDQTLQAPVEGTGAVSGVVIDADGRPLEGAIVSLQRLAARGAGPGSPTPRQATDSKGRFIFTKLVAADYTLNASKLGYFDARATSRIVLVDGQWSSDSKITLLKPGAISGVITDESNEPVVGVFVRVLTQVMVSGLPQLAAGATVRTDDRGVYRIPGLSAGKYVVVVPSVQSSVPADTTDITMAGLTPDVVASGRELPQHNNRLMGDDGKNLLWIGVYLPPPAGARAMAYPTTYYPAARTPRDATTVDLKGSEERSGVDLQLRPVPVVRVSGVVDAPAEAEAPGMTLRLLPSGAENLANGSEAATALVASDRTFTFLNVPSGDYIIIASRSQMEYQQSRLNSIVSTPTLPKPPAVGSYSSGVGTIASGSAGAEYSYSMARGAQTHSGRVPVTVGARDLTDVVVALKRAVTLSGKLVYEMEKPPQGGPPSLPVYAEPPDGNAALGMMSGHIAQGSDLTFSIDGLQLGPYALRFLGLRGGIKSIMWDGKDYTDKAFDASAGLDITGVVVTVTDKTTKLSGYVRDARNQPVGHGNVIVFPADSAQWSGYGFSPRRILSTSIGSNGAYTVSTLGAGTYLAIAVDESLATAWQDPKFLAAAAPLASRVTIEWGDTQSIDLVLKSVPGFGK